MTRPGGMLQGCVSNDARAAGVTGGMMLRSSRENVSCQAFLELDIMV